MKKTKIIATFMIILVLTIPVFSSAQSVELKKYSGKDDVDGIARERNEEFSIEVIAQRPDKGTIVGDNVWLAPKRKGGYVAEYRFNNCEVLTDGNHKCTYSQKNPRSGSYRVELRDENNNPYASPSSKAEFKLVVDSQAPVIEELDYSLTSEGKLKVNYKITEGDGQKCSGIKNAEFFLKEGTAKRPLKTITPSGNKGQCTALEGSFEANAPSSQLVHGSLCANATDYFGQFDDECADFAYDKKPPTIKNPKIIGESGAFELTHVKGSGEINAQLAVEVEGDSREGVNDVKEVVADLSNLGGEPEKKLAKLDGNKFSTTFTISQTNNCKYTIKAKDSSGNEASKDFTCTLPLDATPPTVKEVITIPAVLGREGNITVIFEDLDDEGNEGIGVGGNVGISVEEMRVNREPDECAKRGNAEWRCDWVVKLSANTQSGDKKITVTGADALENRMEPYDGGIKVDLEVPEGLSVDYEVLGGETKAARYPILGNTIKFTLKGQDVNSAKADFTRLGGSEESVSCIKDECVFTQDVQKGTTPGDKKIKFTAFDKAGNKRTMEKLVRIYDTVKGRAQREGYWEVGKVECMPSKIDRKEVSQFVGFPVYCKIELTPNDANIQVASITTRLKDCTGDFVKENNVRSVELITDDSPYLEFVFEPKETKENTATIDCKIKISTLKDNKVIVDKDKGVYIETETVQSVLNFYGDSLKDIYAETEADIKVAIDAAEKWYYQISALKTVIDWFERICQLKSVFVGLLAIWQFFHFDWMTAEYATRGIPGADVATYEVRVSACLAKESGQHLYASSLVTWLDPFCSAVSCRSATGGGWASYVGGNWNPLCADLDKFLNTPEFREASGALKQVKNKQSTGQEENINVLNVKESIVWSTFCFCPVGILHNLDKARQIDCRFATCLIDDVKNRGVPIDECKQMRSEMKCAYWFGEVWNAIPYTQLFDKLVNVITQILTDPSRLLSIALGAHCTMQCSLPDPQVPWYCTGISLAASMGEAYSTISDAQEKKGLWSKEMPNDYCKRLDDIKGPYTGESGGEEEE